MSFLSDKRNLTTVVKFIAALLVVNNHVIAYYGNMPEINPWICFGSQCVSLFLFFSAYGLMFAFEQNGEVYLQSFLPRRLGRILIPFLTAYSFSLLIYASFKGPIDWVNVVSTLYWGGSYLQFSWYVTEIVILYIVFYMCAKVCKNVRRLSTCLYFAVVLLIALLMFTKQPVWYINGLPCFILGVWYQKNERIILNYIERYKWMLVSVFSIAFLLTFQWHYMRDFIPALSAYRYAYIAMYLSNLLFVSIVIICINNISDNSNIRIRKLSMGGAIIRSFYEIYLIQNAVMIIVTSFVLPFGWTWLLIIIGVIILGYAMNMINTNISTFIFRK